MTIGIVAALVTEVLYGCSFVFTKGATGVVDPVTLLAWRFATALLVLLALWGARVIRLSISRATLKPLLLLAVFQPLAYYLAETYGVRHTTASEAALLIASIPVVNLVVAAVVLGSRPNRHQLVGITVTLVGVLTTIVAGGLALGFNVFGYAMLLLAVLSFALYAVFAERHAHARDIDKTFVMVATGALGFGGLALAQHASAGTYDRLLAPLAHTEVLISIAYLALGSTIGAFFLQNVAIARIGATRFSTFVGVGTVVSLVAGALVLGERLSWIQVAGGAIILAGVYLANRRARTPGAATGPDPAQQELRRLDSVDASLRGTVRD